MNLTPEQTKELAEFPPVLRALVEAELAAGNAIVEIAHGHPGPPVSALPQVRPPDHHPSPRFRRRSELLRAPKFQPLR